MNSFVGRCLAELSADGFISGFRIKEGGTAKNPASFFLFLVPFLDLLVRPFALWFADIWNQKFQCCRNGTSVRTGGGVNILFQSGGDRTHIEHMSQIEDGIS